MNSRLLSSVKTITLLTDSAIETMWLIVIGKCSVIKQVVVRQKTEFVQTPDPLLFLSLFIRSLSFLCLHSYNDYVISVLFIIICHLHIKKIFCFISTDTCSE